ncbi:L-2-amino-thiazoline-4-carboxylic acid hydrolase [Gilliamella apicola]|uniref:L-2-amino-thiazoline-4-carboxylic acid hydrolase n=1 Tax=Gilliamella apicola TaxID=1196095 RepID=UPI00080E4D94|nr:L-2-amino-thiazoline-4-carboxylic acid hydrolase [Gilliamella apicola]OCG11932.1 2-amino-thiazoline-4-carboxylic acid hydrolase [Gilliamella apicola]ORF44062.1 2-amino-thiazoline-4-carboxylic acid hydrolase [Gilliamella apicola]ORF47289.1 2-amino-thiazoline-4-carboxylic acid hydrolase [Gilliamella apicola]ORF47387.1 2-amino-thiazoline-4-carboxylic acid hydrolase [Gilliamella apicola]ORF51037.1 2-amino-thiazoline-4-carboxylic acid hydrolase [Gilliamella apicola]
MQEFPEIGILHRRKIEAEIIKPIYEILIRNYGNKAAKAVIEEAVAKAAIDAGKAFAAKEPNGTSVESFVALQHLWEQDDALTITVVESSHEKYDYNVHRCKYAEMYKEMGLAEIGFLLSCNRDSKFIEGYAPQVNLDRPHTIMMGDGICDFRYCLRVKNDE